MKLMSEKEAAEWSRQRDGGENYYLFKTTLLWACVFTIVMSLFEGFTEPELDVLSIIIRFIVSLFGGAFLSIYNWSTNEKKYREFCRNNPGSKS